MKATPKASILLVIFVAFMLSSCVSLPIPPGGPDAGKLGRLELKLVYTPNINGTISYFLARQQKPTPK